MAANGDDYAIVVGIGRYPGLGEVAADAEAKAREFAAWLTEASGGGLPPANVLLLVSGGTAPNGAPGPQLWEVHRALDALGANGGGRAGRRLYACFAGCGSGDTLDELALLLADAGTHPAPWPALPLALHREHLRRAAAFSEFVFLADVSRVAGPVAPQPPRAPELPEFDVRRTPSEFIVAGDAVIRDAVAVLEQASRAGRGWRLEASDLASRIRTRQNRRGTPSPWLCMEEARPGGGRPGLAFGAPAGREAAATGDVAVEVPHWATAVTALDRLMRPAAQAGAPEREGLGRYVARLRRLSVGVYTIEAQLGGSAARRSVLVAPGEETRISLADAPPGGVAASGGPPPQQHDEGLAAPAGLHLATAAPLDETPTTREWHTGDAVRTSRATTWSPPDLPPHDAAAGLFVFVRTLLPERFPDFAEGLALLDSDERPLVDLTAGAVERGRGWLAFGTRLPPGAYVLRLEARRGARIRHQPLHLCGGWDTQVFLAAERLPALQSMALGIVPRGGGFNPADRAAAATQALFESMRAGLRAPGFLAESSSLREVIRSSPSTAPWLAVLAAHALRAGDRGTAAERTAEDLLEELLEGLAATLGAHPDVRALRLETDVRDAAGRGNPADFPFPHPPTLRAGLQCVQRFAIRAAGVVPPGSLTERVACGLVADSPWTAWREASAGCLEEAPRRGAMLASSMPPKAPVFRAGPAPPAADAAYAPQAATLADTLGDLSLVMAAQAVAAAVDAGAEPGPRLAVDPDGFARGLLAPVDAAQASTALGLSLGRVELGLERLRLATSEDGHPPVEASEAVRFVEESVLGYAVRLSAGEPTAAQTEVPRTTIEACSEALLAEAEQLEEGEAGDVAGRLRRAARELLRHADLVAVTDGAGRQRVNGAWLELRRGAGGFIKTALESATGAASGSTMEASANGDPVAAATEGAGQGFRAVARTTVEREGDGTSIGSITVLRDLGADRLPAEALAGIDTVLPRLSLFASLRLHGSEDHRERYAGSLDDAVGEVERLLWPHGVQASSAPPKNPQANGDEDRQFGPQKIRFIGNFHKTLPHNEFGEVKVGSYEEFRTIAADSNAPGAGDFELVDRGPLSFQPHQTEPDCASKKKEADLLVNPLAGRAKETCGPDPRKLNMLPAPEVLSDSTAADMTELYWMALLRDVSFDLFPQAGQLDTAAGDLKQAFERALANDKADGRLRLGLDLPKGADGKLRLDAQTLFRAGLPDEDHGPLVSQFFLHDVQYGTQTIKQHQFPYRAERDYLTDHKSWLLAQNAGYDRHCLPYPNANSYFDDKQVFDDPPPGETLPRKHRIRNMRDLARFVHKDALHQAYFNAALLLLQWNVPPDPGNPYRNGTYSRQRDFATLGGPHILTLVSEVATRALKAVWRQKWLVHRRLRPEAYGGLMQMQELGYEGTKRPYGLPHWVFGSQAAQAVRNKHGTYFLPMPFTSGSPPHPAYGAGHATVAGACVTMLKAWFKEDEPIGAIIEKNVHPDTLQKLRMLQPKETPDDNPPAYAGADAGKMTVGGELNKIAANVAMGRSMGGVHWRSDNTRSLRLGEQIATIMLKRQSKDYAEKPFHLSYVSFDGKAVRVEDGTVQVEGDPELDAFYKAF